MIEEKEKITFEIYSVLAPCPSRGAPVNGVESLSQGLVAFFKTWFHENCRIEKKTEKVTLVNPFRPSDKNMSYTALFSRNMTLKVILEGYPTGF